MCCNKQLKNALKMVKKNSETSRSKSKKFISLTTVYIKSWWMKSGIEILPAETSVHFYQILNYHAPENYNLGNKYYFP
jgi:hypothetical protein